MQMLSNKICPFCHGSEEYDYADRLLFFSCIVGQDPLKKYFWILPSNQPDVYLCSSSHEDAGDALSEAFEHDDLLDKLKNFPLLD